MKQIHTKGPGGPCGPSSPGYPWAPWAPCILKKKQEWISWQDYEQNTTLNSMKWMRNRGAALLLNFLLLHQGNTKVQFLLTGSWFGICFETQENICSKTKLLKWGCKSSGKCGLNLHGPTNASNKSSILQIFHVVSPIL